MKRFSVFLLSGLILIYPGLIGYGTQHSDDTYQFTNSPLIEGIYEETAYTLGSGEWKVGEISFPGRLSQWKWLYVKYGPTERFQFGTTIPQNFLGRPNLSGKYQLPLEVPASGKLAIPASIEINLSPPGLSSNTGLVASWSINEKTSLHTGVNLWLVSFIYRLFNPSAYLIADYNLLPNLTLIGEVNIHSFGEDFSSIRIGGLFRTFRFLNLKLSANIDFPSGDVSGGANLFLRF